MKISKTQFFKGLTAFVLSGTIAATVSGCSNTNNHDANSEAAIVEDFDVNSLTASMSSDLREIEEESHAISKVVLNAQLINLYSQKDHLTDNETKAFHEAAYALVDGLNLLDEDVYEYIRSYTDSLLEGNEELKDYGVKSIVRDVYNENEEDPYHDEPFEHYIISVGDLDSEGVELHVLDGTNMDSLLDLHMSRLSTFKAAASDYIHHDVETNDVTNIRETANTAMDIVASFMAIDESIHSNDGNTYDMVYDNHHIGPARRNIVDKLLGK